VSLDAPSGAVEPPSEDVVVVPESPLVVPASPAGGGGGGGANGAQVPSTEPGITWQVPPTQQSASTVQGPLVGEHEVAPQRSTPLGSGTHGLPSQQLAESAQVSPTVRQASPPLQRGTPKESGSQTPAPAEPVAPQQSLRAESVPQTAALL
jgi:hypothetical protein